MVRDRVCLTRVETVKLQNDEETQCDSALKQRMIDMGISRVEGRNCT